MFPSYREGQRATITATHNDEKNEYCANWSKNNCLEFVCCLLTERFVRRKARPRSEGRWGRKANRTITQSPNKNDCDEIILTSRFNRTEKSQSCRERIKKSNTNNNLVNFRLVVERCLGIMFGSLFIFPCVILPPLCYFNFIIMIFFVHEQWIKRKMFHINSIWDTHTLARTMSIEQISLCRETCPL